MADVAFFGGPLNGQSRESAASVINVVDDTRAGLVRLVTYGVADGVGRVIAEEDL